MAIKNRYLFRNRRRLPLSRLYAVAGYACEPVFCNDCLSFRLRDTCLESFDQKKTGGLISSFREETYRRYEKYISSPL